MSLVCSTSEVQHLQELQASQAQTAQWHQHNLEQAQFGAGLLSAFTKLAHDSSSRNRDNIPVFCSNLGLHLSKTHSLLHTELLPSVNESMSTQLETQEVA